MTVVVLLVLLLALLVAVSARRDGARQAPEDFFVASGRFGSILFFFLAVGETYSIATILGVPAGVFAHGTGFLEWFLGYILLAFPVGYMLNPCLWRAGRRTGAVTLPDMLRGHFQSRTLELVVTLSSLLFLLPMGVMQFVGLETVLGALGWPVPTPLLLFAAAASVLLMVSVAGIRGPARVAVLKDALMLLAVLLAGGAALFALGTPAAPITISSMPPASPALTAPAAWSTDLFAMSTILLQSVGFCLVPHTVAGVFTARSVSTLRRAQSVMPLYMVMFPLLVAVAYAARHASLVPPGSDPNGVLLFVAKALLPSWGFGAVLAGAALSALVVLSGICLAIGPLVVRNLVPGLSGDQQRRVARLVMAAFLLLSLGGALRFHGLMVSINNVFYFGITQVLPGIVAMLALERARPGAIAGALLFGDAVSIGLHAAGVPLGGINPGLLGLGANAGLLCLLTALFPGPARMPTERGALRSAAEEVSAGASGKEHRHDVIA